MPEKLEGHLDDGNEMKTPRGARSRPAARRGASRKTSADLPAEQPPFLREGIGAPPEEGETYDLEREFAKSRGNRSVPIHVAIVAFALALAAVSAWFIYDIQRGMDRTTVGIADFRDINLQELLAALQRARQELGKMEDTIAVARQKAQLEIERIRHEAAREIRKVEQSGLGQAEKRRIIERIRAEEDRRLRENRRVADGAIKQKAAEAAAARARLTAFEKRAAAEQAAAIKDSDLKVRAAYRLGDEKEQLVQSKLREQRTEHQERIKDFERELKEVKAAVDKEAERASDTDNLLALYRRALTYYAKSRGEHGFVIDPGSGGTMLVDVNPFLDLKAGDRAYVLNKDNKIVALVEIRPAGRRVMAKVVKRMKSGAIQPFDKILLKKN